MGETIKLTAADGHEFDAYRAEPEGDEPRVWPVFQGNIGEDVTFFGFPLTPAAARDYWLVVEEAPSGYRFRSDLSPNPTDGAQFAQTRLDAPSRVLIRGDYLIPEI